MTSVEIIASFFSFFSRTLFPRPVCSCRGDGAVCSRVWSKLAGTEEEAAVWTGWAAFSSRAFQNLPGASLKQKEEEEEEEVGLPVGMLQANRDPIGTAAFNVDRRSRSHTVVISRVSVTEALHQAAARACVVYAEPHIATQTCCQVILRSGNPPGPLLVTLIHAAYQKHLLPGVRCDRELRVTLSRE